MQALTNTRLHVHVYELKGARSAPARQSVATLKDRRAVFDLQEICVDLQTPPTQKTINWVGGQALAGS